MTAAQLGRRLGLATSTVVEIEQREVSGKVTLETINRVAAGIGCKVVYALVPVQASSLEALFDEQARRAATALVSQSEHSMHLEKQSVEHAETSEQLEVLAEEIKRRKDPSVMWEVP